MLRRLARRRPPLSLFHSSQWELHTAAWHGAASGGDDQWDRTYLGVTHTTIDDNATVMGFLRMRLRQKVSP